jgi:hypothetical protein
MFETRGKTILPTGTTPKVLRARTTKAVTEIRKRIEQLAVPYEEVDNSVTGAVGELLSAFDKFEQHIKDTQRFLEEAA